MKKVKGALSILCIAVLIIALLAGCGGKTPRKIGGISLGEHKVIATVNGEDVYEDVYMEWYLETMSLSLSLDMSEDQDEQVTSFLEEYKYNYLVGYAEQVALLQQTKTMGITVSGQEVEDYIAQIMMWYQADAEYFKSLQAMWGFTDKSFHEYLTQQLTLQKLYAEVTGNITEADMTPAEYYEIYPEEFLIGELRTVRHILVEDPGEAADIVARLNAGADFDEMVAEKSTDPGAAVNGGSYGPFDSTGAFADGSGALVEPFTEASFALEKVGDITQTPAESDFGYHIIILDELYPEHTIPFGDVESDIADHLLNDAKENCFNEYYSQVMEAADISYDDSVAMETPYPGF